MKFNTISLSVIKLCLLVFTALQLLEESRKPYLIHDFSDNQILRTRFHGVPCFYCLHSKLVNMQYNHGSLCFKWRTGLGKSLPCFLPAQIIHDSMAL